MFKEVVIIILILVFIFTLNSITQNYTNASVEAVENDFSLIREKLLEDEINKDELIENINTLKEKWNKRHQKLAYYIEHNELEKVDTYLVAVNGNIEIEDYEQALENLDICKYVIDHISDKKEFTLKNIF